MPKLYFLCLIFLITQIGFSQSNINQFKSNTTSGVTITAQEETCKITQEGIDYQHIVISVENTNNFPVIVEWDNQLNYTTGCFNCNSDNLNSEYHRSIQVPANSTRTGSCSYPKDNDLTIFKAFNAIESESKLVKFNLQNISVSNPSNY